MSNVDQITDLKVSRGPWVVRKHCCTIYIGPVSKGGAQEHVCTIDVSPAFGTKRLEQSERNALLIAAAPDLLDAVIAIKALTPEKSAPIQTLCDKVIEQATKAPAGAPYLERGFALGLLGGSVQLAKYILSAVAGGFVLEDEHTIPLIAEAKALVFDSETSKA